MKFFKLNNGEYLNLESLETVQVVKEFRMDKDVYSIIFKLSKRTITERCLSKTEAGSLLKMVMDPYGGK